MYLNLIYHGLPTGISPPAHYARQRRNHSDSSLLKEVQEINIIK